MSNPIYIEINMWQMEKIINYMNANKLHDYQEALTSMFNLIKWKTDNKKEAEEK